MNKKNPYPPISDYAYIADCHSAALVSKSGSIDWCCMPRIDSGSCFGRILERTWKMLNSRGMTGALITPER